MHYRRLPADLPVKPLLAGLALVIVIAGCYFLPLPSTTHLRDTSDRWGASFVWVFFACYAVGTIFPIPRSFFTVAAGALFGATTGFVGAMIATTVAAVVAFVVVRWLGRARLARYLMSHRLTRDVERRLQARGWLAVGALRLIAFCPFSLLNYCAAVSAVRFRPYVVATVVGSAPGTAAVVLLGNGLTGGRNPWLLLISALLVLVGLVGLVVDARMSVDGATTDPGQVDSRKVRT